MPAAHSMRCIARKMRGQSGLCGRYPIAGGPSLARRSQYAASDFACSMIPCTDGKTCSSRVAEYGNDGTSGAQ